MNKLAIGGTAAGLGLVVGAGFGVGLEQGAELAINVHQNVEAVNRCAQVLGEKTLNIADVQSSCSEYYGSFPVSMENGPAGSHLYVKTIPGSETFVKDEMPTAVQSDEMRLRVAKGVGIIGGVAVGAMTFVLMNGYLRRREDEITEIPNHTSKSEDLSPADLV